LYCVVLCCIVLYCIVLYCIALLYVLYCIVLYCILFYAKDDYLGCKGECLQRAEGPFKYLPALDERKLLFEYHTH
jgi:hypothetical protein